MSHYTYDECSYGTVLYRPSGKDFAFLQGDDETAFLAEIEQAESLEFPYGVYDTFEDCVSELVSQYDI